MNEDGNVSPVAAPNPLNSPLGSAPIAAPGDTGDVCAAIVTYHPDLDLLRTVLAAVRDQVGRVLVFDNASSGDALEAFWQDIRDARVEVIRSPENVGLGRAINRAADYARTRGFQHLLIMDQDSIVDPDMVATLRGRLIDLQRAHRVAAVGPQFRDQRTGEQAPFVRIGFPLNHKLFGGPGQAVACDFLISSGTLLPLEVLDHVGGMDEGLFIDNVDIEWGSRARYRGFKLFGICDAGMRHRIGDLVRVSPLLPRAVVVHSPTRLYYMMRNRVLLYQRAEVPRLWMAQDVPRLVMKFLSTALFIKPRAAYVASMLRGLRDGLRGRDGAMPHS